MAAEIVLSANGQISEPREVGPGARVTVTGSGWLEWTPSTLADVRNGVATWQPWPRGQAAGFADTLRRVVVRARATGAVQVDIDESRKDEGAEGAYWQEQVPAWSTDAAGNVAGLVGPGGNEAAFVESSSRSVVGALRAEFRRVAAQKVEARLEYARRRWGVQVWRPGEQVEVGMARVPTAFMTGAAPFTMKIHRCVTAGTTGSSEPTWATADHLITPGSSGTNDGTVVWRAYNVYFFDPATGNDTTGDGSQATPWASINRAANYGGTGQVYREGRAMCIRRGSVFSTDTHPSFTSVRWAIDRSALDTALFPERFNVFSYGAGPKPIIDANGLNCALNIITSTASRHRGFISISGIHFRGTVTDAQPALIVAYVGDFASERAGLPMSLKFIDCDITDVARATPTVGGNDLSGVQFFGTDNAMYGCHVARIHDDGVWSVGRRFEFVGNVVENCGQSALIFPTRSRGDCLQITSNLEADRYDSLLIAGNIFDHTNVSGKQTLIVNTEKTGVDVRDSGFVIEWNDIVGFVGSAAINHIPLYISGFQGQVRYNLISGGSVSFPNDGVVQAFCGGEFHSNLVVSYTGQRPIYADTLVLGGGTVTQSPAGLQIFSNTFWTLQPGANGAYVRNVTGPNGRFENNLVVGYGVGADVRAGFEHGKNLFMACATPVAGWSVAVTLGANASRADTRLARGRPSASDAVMVGAAPSPAALDVLGQPLGSASVGALAADVA